MADLSNAYLHCLGQAEAALLADLQGRVPDIVAKAKAESEEARAIPHQTIWGIDLETPGDRRDIILLKYLRAEELVLDKAAERLVQTLVFRADCKIDDLAKAELPQHFQGHDFIDGKDVAGRPVVISRFGGMDLPKVFGDVEAFVRYRAQVMERAIALLTFEKGAPEDLCQVHDYSGVPLLFQTSEVKGGVGAVSKVFGEHYPEFKGVTIFVNFPAAFSKLWKAFSVFIPERTRKKFIILGDKDQAQLFEKISPEVVPECIGGMLRDPPGQLSSPCQLVDVKATEEVTLVQVEGKGTVLWELRVCAFEVAYEVFFVPAGGGDEQVIKRTDSSSSEYLKVEDGVVFGEYAAQGPGSVRCRFKNECAWFKWRLCVCRGELKK